MKAWWLGLGLAGMLHRAQLELDCARPTAARNLIGQAKLSEIEWAEDVNRAAMWEAFGRCPAGPGAEVCREQQRQRFGAELDGQKAAIVTKYQKMLIDFEERCRASITRGKTRDKHPTAGQSPQSHERPRGYDQWPAAS